MENTEELKKFYETDEATLQKCAKIIFDKYTYGRYASDRPFAVVVLGQPGAGKSGLMSYTTNQFPSAVALDIDDLRAYYPRYDEVSKTHPEIFEAVTGRFATQMIHILTPWLIDNKYDLVLHKTRGDDAVIHDTLIPLKNVGYDTMMRVMAVHELESKMSALERSLAQRQKIGYCRWVETPYHNAQYNGIVDLAERLEREGIVDAMEVYVRGEIPVEPGLVYSKIVNPTISTNPHMVTDDGIPVITDYRTDKHPSVRSAIIEARDKAVEEILQTIPVRMERATNLTQTGTDRAHEFIGEIKVLQEMYGKKFASE